MIYLYVYLFIGVMVSLALFMGISEKLRDKSLGSIVVALISLVLVWPAFLIYRYMF